MPTPTEDPNKAAFLERVRTALGRANPILHTPNHPSAHFEDYSSWHSGGVNMLFGDGRVKFLSSNIDAAVFHALATRAGNEQDGGY